MHRSDRIVDASIVRAFEHGVTRIDCDEREIELLADRRLRALGHPGAQLLEAAKGRGMGFGHRLTMVRETAGPLQGTTRSEEHTSELQSLMRISYAVCCLKKKKTDQHPIHTNILFLSMCNPDSLYPQSIIRLPAA